uniref:Heat shock protein 70-3 n=1 Tax=Dugesia japonica TaxID=6161 RepID=A0A649ZU34_DUGJA|nr:heat shock protein 70-3 [Dugesia japonica]
MAVSVVGFDVGTLSSYVVVARQGGIEAVANEYSDRNTPSCVSFTEQMRFIGHEAKQQQVSNISNTILNFTNFLGKTFNDSFVQSEMKRIPFKVVPTADGRVGIEVKYLGETQVFTPEQIYAMQLTKLKEVAEMNLATKVVDVVLNVPTYATDSERRAILDAAQIANLNCVRIINDTTAIGLAYGIYNKELPEPEAQSKNIVFIDFGYSSLQSNVVAFNKGKMRVIASSCSLVGGRDFDEVIYNKVKEEFRDRYKLNVIDGSKPSIRLMQECEKLKKLMSANATEIPLNIECFMNDIDVSSRMKRVEFEELSSDLLQKVKKTLENLIVEAKMSLDDIDSIELVGGSTRIPAVKQIIGEIFKKEGRTSLNADEAVARGCALQCAIMSPAFRVKDFNITDALPYPISLAYDDVNGNVNVDVYQKWSVFPASKQMTFNRVGPFKLEGKYSNPEALPNDNKSIGLFNVSGVQPGPNGEPVKIKVKLRVTANGIFTCCQAQLVEVVEKQVEVEVDAEPQEVNNKTEPMDTESYKGEENGDVTSEKTNETGENEIKKDAPKKIKKMVNKNVTKHTDLPMQAIILQYIPQKINEFNEKENQMIMQVKLQKEKATAKNSVEEYVYEMRDKLYGDLEAYVSENDRDQFSSELTAAENWLYEEGEDVSKQLYIDRLTNLRKIGDRILYRAKEGYERPYAIEEFSKSTVIISKVIAGIDNKEEAYSHLDAADRDNLSKILEEKQQWFAQEINRQRELKSYEDPVLTVSQILSQKQNMESLVNPIVNKPKPVVTPPESNNVKPEPDSSTNSNLNNNTEKTEDVKVDKPEDMDLD